MECQELILRSSKTSQAYLKSVLGLHPDAIYPIKSCFVSGFVVGIEAATVANPKTRTVRRLYPFLFVNDFCNEEV
jgi:hypothetical protein